MRGAHNGTRAAGGPMPATAFGRGAHDAEDEADEEPASNTLAL